MGGHSQGKLFALPWKIIFEPLWNVVNTLIEEIKVYVLNTKEELLSPISNKH